MELTIQHNIICNVSAYLRESGCTGPVVIDAVDTDAYVVAAVLWQKLAEKAGDDLLPRPAS